MIIIIVYIIGYISYILLMTVMTWIVTDDYNLAMVSVDNYSPAVVAIDNYNITTASDDHVHNCKKLSMQSTVLSLHLPQVVLLTTKMLQQLPMMLLT